MKSRIGVIIPFYQKKNGLLERAVESVKNQTIKDNIDLIIVDDESPLPADRELCNWDPEQLKLRIIKQQNAGPGIARNNGINNLEHVEFISFLDSDDYWEENHLESAMKAFEAGADIYFSDFKHENGKQHFQNLETELCSHYRQYASNSPFRISQNESLQMLILHGYVHTPTVVYRYDKYKSIRFPTTFYFFGEDQTFWLQLACQGARAIFSTHIDGFSGSGVNIYSESAYGTKKRTLIIRHEILYRKYILDALNLSTNAIYYSKNRLKSARRNMAHHILHHLKKHRFAFALEHLLFDPLIISYLPTTLLQSLFSKFRRF